MNIQEYINSGIIEQYVFGNVTPQEKQEVECMSHIYPEIKQELQSQQEAIEQYAISMQVAPPPDLKAKILAKIKEEGKNTESLQSEISTETISSSVNGNQKSDNLRQIDARPMRTGRIRLLAAASIVCCILLAGLNYYQATNFEDKLASMTTKSSAMEEKMAIMQDPTYQKVIMPGIKEKSPSSIATVYWNKNKKAVYLNPSNLPKPGDDKQYQLWVIKDGVPVDMGMLPQDFTSDTLVKMKDIDNAQAFAITLENEGGVPSPTMSEMYVMASL